MQVSTSEAKPPYVTFEYRSVASRDATGMPTFRDVAFAIITPAGSKDRIEKIAEEWLSHIQAESRVTHPGEEPRFPPAWARHYTQSYEAWRSGQELPVDGTAIKNWPVLTPAQVKTLLHLNVITVEQLAQANEETILRIGMGGRALVAQAKDFLASRSGPSKLVAELNTFRLHNENLANENTELRKRTAALEAQMTALLAAAPGIGKLADSSPGISSSDILPDD